MDELHRAIGRMIWVGIRGAVPGDAVLESELALCESASVGGVILFDVDVPGRDAGRASGLDEAAARLASPRNVLDPGQTARLVGYLRERLGPGLIVSVDQEGGVVSRLSPARGFPPVPSARDYAALDVAGRASACGRMVSGLLSAGVDLNLSPCVDVAVNPDGPGHTGLGRSFGRDPARVASMAREQIDAMHAGGIACCLKHFPGHGSAEGDTHHGLVDVTRTWVWEDELAPYRELLGVADTVMVAHVLHRGLDAARPASLSGAVIGGLLRGELGYDGVVLTDSLDMRAVSDRYGAGEASLLAVLGGVDAVLEGNNLSAVAPCPAPRIHARLREAVRRGELTEDRIMRSVSRLERLSARRVGWRGAS